LDAKYIFPITPPHTPPRTPTPSRSNENSKDPEGGGDEEREAFTAVDSTVGGLPPANMDDSMEERDISLPDDGEQDLLHGPPPGLAIVRPWLAPVRAEGYLVLEQEIVYTQVLVPVEEEGLLPSTYMVGAVLEYIRTLNYQHIPVKSFLYEFLIDQLVRHQRFYQLHQFLQYHVIADSLHVACQLLSLESSYAPCYQLALDMLKRLGAHDQIVEVLLAKSYVLPALRYAQKLSKQRITALDLRPQRFLDGAKSDPHVFYAVFMHFLTKGKIDDEALAPYRDHFDASFAPSSSLQAEII